MYIFIYNFINLIYIYNIIISSDGTFPAVLSCFEQLHLWHVPRKHCKGSKEFLFALLQDMEDAFLFGIVLPFETRLSTCVDTQTCWKLVGESRTQWSYQQYREAAKTNLHELISCWILLQFWQFGLDEVWEFCGLATLHCSEVSRRCNLGIIGTIFHVGKGI